MKTVVIILAVIGGILSILIAVGIGFGLMFIGRLEDSVQVELEADATFNEKVGPLVEFDIDFAADDGSFTFVGSKANGDAVLSVEDGESVIRVTLESGEEFFVPFDHDRFEENLEDGFSFDSEDPSPDEASSEDPENSEPTELPSTDSNPAGSPTGG